MNKQELIDAVAASIDESKASTGAAIEAILDVVTHSDMVRLIGSGSFSAGTRPERTGRYSSMGEIITIPVVKTVRFIAGKAFRHAVSAAAGSSCIFHHRLNLT
jgi:DNA-binding protein HU-beta